MANIDPEIAGSYGYVPVPGYGLAPTPYTRQVQAADPVASAQAVTAMAAAGFEPSGGMYIPSGNESYQGDPTVTTFPVVPTIAPLVSGAPGGLSALSALGITIPPALLAAIGAVGAGYAAFQALGGGEGGGLFGLNLLGGDDFTLGGVEFGGPGLSEPTVPYKEWRAGDKQFYFVKTYTKSGAYAGGKVFMYNSTKKIWKYWRLPKPHLAVIGKNMPRHQMIVRLRKNLSRHTADAKSILRLTSPKSLRVVRTRRK